MFYIILFQCLVNFVLTFYLKKAYNRVSLLEKQKQDIEDEFDNFVDLFNKQEVERQDALGEKILSVLEKELQYSEMLLTQEPYGDA